MTAPACGRGRPRRVAKRGRTGFDGGVTSPCSFGLTLMVEVDLALPYLGILSS